MNAKRIWRLYREEGLSIRTKQQRRRRAWRYRIGRNAAVLPNEVWAMDFMSDALFDGRPFRLLTVLDCHTREALADRSWPPVPGKNRQADFQMWTAAVAGRMLDQWAYLNGVEIAFSRPGKPTDNGHIEAFNGRLRAECLNASWFLSLADA